MDIHFSSGKIRKVESGRLTKFIEQLKGRGIKLMIDRERNEKGQEVTLIVPLNSSTMEFIEHVDETVPEPEIVDEPMGTTSIEEMQKELELAHAEMDAKKDTEEKQEDALKELMDKSNCTHANKVLYVQETRTGPRYFPVCADCGLRERYVKAASLTDESKEAAKVWED